MQDNKTISGIIAATHTLASGPSISFSNRVIELYKSFESEEHYDVDDISTLVCEVLVTELDETMDTTTPEHTQDIRSCRMIYDIFNICKQHVRRSYLYEFAKEAHQAEAKRSMDRLSYLK